MGRRRLARRSLEVPHPRLAERRFALLPLLDLDPDLALPDGRRLADLAGAIDPADQPVEASRSRSRCRGRGRGREL